jgi:signal transduction histidine kinase
VIAAFIVLLISRFLRPIEKIVAAMEKIGEGDLNRKIGLHTGDEIEMIANAVDQMTMRLKDVTVARDVLAAEIEERRKVERRLMEVSDQLIQSEKMASVGQLAAGVAHEINNPIGFVSSNLEALKVYFDRLGRIMDHYARIEAYLRTLSADEAVRLCGSLDKLKEECDLNYVLEDIPKIFEDCSAGVQRVAATVRDLRVFSHKGSLEKQYEDVNSLLETALRVLGGAMRHKVVLKKNLAADLPRVRCHPQHLSQVFVNLILNAIQSIEDQGQISIRTFSTEGKVFVEIADTGAGMEEGVLHKIFDPFFTTKEVGVGTGLGLSISYGIIQNHGGEIRVSSKVKAGSTFTVILPAEGFEFPV